MEMFTGARSSCRLHPNEEFAIMPGSCAGLKRAGSIMRSLRPTETHEKFHQGLEQFNHRRFFDAHETWEEIWLAAPEPEKTFLQGIIQVAAAFHHYTRGNPAGTRSLLQAGLRKLEGFSGKHHGIRLEELRAAARRWIAALAAGEDPGPEELPRIEPARRR
jgi:predicted metal-dependent hydrolase